MSIFQKIIKAFNPKSLTKTIEEQMEPYGISAKRSTDSLRAEVAQLMINDELSKDLPTDKPSKYLFALYKHTINAVGIFDSSIAGMFRAADRKEVRARLNLFHQIIEEWLANTWEAALYAQHTEETLSEVTDLEWRKAQERSNWTKASTWGKAFRTTVIPKLRQVCAEAWGEKDKIGTIHYVNKSNVPPGQNYPQTTMQQPKEFGTEEEESQNWGRPYYLDKEGNEGEQ